MTTCNFCHQYFDHLPFKCKYCRLLFCKNCHLPETHHCYAPPRGNIFSKVNNHHHRDHWVGADHHESQGKSHGFVSSTVNGIKRWAHRRPDYSDIDKKEARNGLLLAILFTIATIWAYLNIDKLNEIKIWILPFGSLGVIVLGYYWLKYIYRTLCVTYQWLAGQKNWVRLVLVLALGLMVWNLFHDGMFLDKSVIAIKKISFDKIIPFQLNGTVLTSNKGDSVNLANYLPKPVNTSDVELAIYRETNSQRAANGLRPLKFDEELSVVAREHSQDMAKNNFFSHTNLQGEDPSARATRHGYYTEKALGGGVFSIGIAENIGKMPTGSVEGVGYVSSDANSIAKAQVDSWMGSPGHRANILNPQYDTIGVGVAYDGHLYYLSTQDFK